MSKLQNAMVGAAIAAIMSTPSFAGEHGHEKSHWGYSGEAGPGYWGSLKADYAACGAGTQQSPINVQTQRALASSIGNIEFSYKPTPIKVLNNGHTIQVNYNPGNTMTVSGKTYELLQFHFHSPSEHMINDRHSQMEVHLVHKGADGKLAVVGVMMNTGKALQTLAPVWSRLPYELNKVSLNPGTVNAADLLPANTQNYYHYMGSLTTPPCTEGVSWYVMKDAVEVASAQAAKFSNLIGDNARPVQGINRRLILANE